MLNVVYGNEPYFIQKYIKKLKRSIELPEFNLREFQGLTEDFFVFLSTCALMEERKACIVYLKTIKELDKKEFLSWVDTDEKDVNVLVVMDDLDKRTSVYKVLSKKNVLTDCNKMKDTQRNDFEKIIMSELKNIGAKITNSAFKEFIRRINYFEQPQYSLLEVIGQIQKLYYYNPEISLENVELLIEDNEKEDVFVLAKELDLYNVEQLYKEVDLLIHAEGFSAIGSLSVLLREFRIAYKYVLFSDKALSNADFGIYKKPFFIQYPHALLGECMQSLVEMIDKIKHGFEEKAAMSIAISKLLVLLKAEC